MTQKMTTPETGFDLEEVERITINHYDSHAESFWFGTRDHDVSQNINALLSALPGNQALDILDLGCGPGRDLFRFRQLGHKPVGIDGSGVFCEMAREYSHCPVLHQQFLSLDLGIESFDGIYANASLFHIPSQKLLEVLQKCHRALRTNGVLFTSNPRGKGEGWQSNRYGHYMEFEDSCKFLDQAGFSVVDHYYRPEGLPRDQQAWLAIVSKKI